MGIDASRAMLELARERHPEIRLVECDLTDDWPSVVGDGFDLVLTANTVHHVEGEVHTYARRASITVGLRKILAGASRIAMEYSPG